MISCYTSELLALGSFVPNQMEAVFIESIEKKFVHALIIQCRFVGLRHPTTSLQ